jgi:hypothetical protein
VIEYWFSLKGKPYELQRSEEWKFDFPPILHWKNLPSVNSVYGKSDIESILVAQDRLNFTNSNISKIIRYHAHPKTVATGVSAKSIEKVAVGADEMVVISSDTARVFNLEMQSDLSSSRAFALDVQRNLHDISRTVDTSSIADKVGSLTNFGLRVLYSDALAKNATKRLLYGEALLELTRRVLVLQGFEGTASAPGVLEWGEALPANEQENAELVLADYQAGLIDQETALRLRGYDAEDVLQKVQAEQKNKQNAGGLLLADFFAKGK